MGGLIGFFKGLASKSVWIGRVLLFAVLFVIVFVAHLLFSPVLRLFWRKQDEGAEIAEIQAEEQKRQTLEVEKRAIVRDREITDTAQRGLEGIERTYQSQLREADTVETDEEKEIERLAKEGSNEERIKFLLSRQRWTQKPPKMEQ